MSRLAWAATWDATNVADGSVAVVTPISMDHTRYLGDTIELIATEKAGIIKPGAVAVLAQQPVEAAEVLLRRASETGASVAREGIEFGVLQQGRRARRPAAGASRPSRRVRRPVPATVRRASGEQRGVRARRGGGVRGSASAGALAAGRYPAVGGTGGALDAPLVREAFAQMTSPGRLEVVRRSPTVLVDAAHNPAGMAATVAAVEESFAFAPLVGVVAVSADKDVPGILEQLEPVLSEVVVTRNSGARAMEVPALAELAGEIFGPERVQAAARLDDAIDIAVGLADAAEAEGFGGGAPGSAGVLITGSVVTAGEARLLLTRPAAAATRGHPAEDRDAAAVCHGPGVRAIVIVLAIPVAIVIGHAGPARAVSAGAAAAWPRCCSQAWSGAWAGGPMWQARAAGLGDRLWVVVPVMFFLGAVFAALWITGMRLGYRVEHSRDLSVRCQMRSSPSSSGGVSAGSRSAAPRHPGDEEFPHERRAGLARDWPELPARTWGPRPQGLSGACSKTCPRLSSCPQ